MRNALALLLILTMPWGFVSAAEPWRESGEPVGLLGPWGHAASPASTQATLVPDVPVRFPQVPSPDVIPVSATIAPESLSARHQPSLDLLDF